MATSENIQDGSPKRDRRFVPASHLASKQLFHFLVWTCLPFLICILWFCVYRQIDWVDVALFAAMWTLTGGLGISLGFHRYFTHAGYDAHPILESSMAAAGSMAAQGPITYWVSLHRCHHKYSDEAEDPHSPNPIPHYNHQNRIRRIGAFLHGHIGWVIRHDVPSPVFFARDLLKHPLVKFFDQTYWGWVFVGILLPGSVMLLYEPSIHGFLRGCVFGGILRIVIGNQIIWAINSVCHVSGFHDFDTGDKSTNNWLLAIPSFGEGWHNNHHAFPWSARFGLRWWQLDVGWLALCFFSLIGLASNLKSPTEEQIGSIVDRLSKG